MINNDNSTSDYDIGIMKKNISRLMKDKDITQSQLADIAGMNQSRVSKILNPETSDCFTIQQLVAIAQALHVSTDFILGIKTEEVPQEKAEITLADICIRLFELDDIAPISFSTCITGEYTQSENPYDDPIALESPCIFFKNKAVSDFIAEWSEMKDVNIKNELLKNNIYATWKSGTITQNKFKLKRLNFQNKYLYQLKLAKSILEDSELPFGIAPLDEIDIRLLKEYIGSQSYIHDFNAKQQGILEHYLESYNPDPS